MTVAFIDVEASGLGTGSFPIEIGVALPALLPDGSWEIDVQSRLIRPTAAWWDEQDLWDSAAQQIHGLSRDHIMEHGEPPAEIAAWLDGLLIGRLVLADTGSHGSDEGWLSGLGAATGDAWWPTRWRLNDWPTTEHIAGRAKASGCSGTRLTLIREGAPPHTHAAGEDALRQAWMWVQSGSPMAVLVRVSQASRYRRRW